MIFLINKENGEFLFSKTLPKILNEYPDLVKSTVEHYISRKKIPFENDKVKIYKGDLIK